MEDDLVTGIAQERGPARHQGQYPIFAFLAQIVFSAGNLGHPSHQRFGLMGVEVVTDDVPACDLGIGGHDGLHVSQKIFLRARGSSMRGDDLSAHDITAHNDAARAMTLLLEFASLHFSIGQR
jgi:hypothetical protein